jgi:site-specific DNA recombinase
MKKRPGTTPPTSNVRRCAIYTRKSTTAGLEQEFNTLDAQRESCATYVQRQPGWVVLDTRYDDGGFTGANIDRPAFQRLLADIDARKIDIVVVYKVDRLSRSLLDFAQVMERLNAADTSFVSITQNFSTADAMGRLTMNMLMSFAEFEREMIGDRTRDKIAASRRKGKWTGGWVPFGYDVKDKHLLVNELEALVVREAFDLLLEHRQMAAVARTLNERRHWPRGSRKPAGQQPVWTKDSIARILRSPLYAGFISCGDEVFPGEHPALITEDVHRRAQSILEANERELTFAGTNPDYVLRGLLRCGRCQAAMSPGSTHSKGREYRYYRCSTRDKAGSEACTAPPLAAGAIESFVAERIAQATQDGSLVASVREALTKRIEDRRAAVESARSKLPSRIASLSADASRLTDELMRHEGRSRELVAGKLNVETEKLEAAEQQLAAVKHEFNALDGMAAETSWVASTLADFSKVWDVLTSANRGRLLRALVDRVSVDEASAEFQIHLVDFSGADTAAEDISQEAA